MVFHSYRVVPGKIPMQTNGLPACYAAEGAEGEQVRFLIVYY